MKKAIKKASRLALLISSAPLIECASLFGLNVQLAIPLIATRRAMIFLQPNYNVGAESSLGIGLAIKDKYAIALFGEWSKVELQPEQVGVYCGMATEHLALGGNFYLPTQEHGVLGGDLRGHVGPFKAWLPNATALHHINLTFMLGGYKRESGYIGSAGISYAYKAVKITALWGKNQPGECVVIWPQIRLSIKFKKLTSRFIKTLGVERNSVIIRSSAAPAKIQIEPKTQAVAATTTENPAENRMTALNNQNVASRRDSFSSALSKEETTPIIENNQKQDNCSTETVSTNAETEEELGNTKNNFAHEFAVLLKEIENLDTSPYNDPGRKIYYTDLSEKEKIMLEGLVIVKHQNEFLQYLESAPKISDYFLLEISIVNIKSILTLQSCQNSCVEMIFLYKEIFLKENQDRFNTFCKSEEGQAIIKHHQNIIQSLSEDLILKKIRFNTQVCQINNERAKKIFISDFPDVFVYPAMYELASIKYFLLNELDDCEKDENWKKFVKKNIILRGSSVFFESLCERDFFEDFTDDIFEDINKEDLNKYKIHKKWKLEKRLKEIKDKKIKKTVLSKYKIHDKWKLERLLKEIKDKKTRLY